MTLADRIILIDRMIQEDSEATIREYIELVKEFDKIRVATEEQEIIAMVIMKPRKRGPKKKMISINETFKKRYKELR